MEDLTWKLAQRKLHQQFGRYKRLSRYEMIDTVTNRVIECSPKAIKSEKALFRQFKPITRLVMQNFYGTNAERLLKLPYDDTATDTTYDWKYCLRKLMRRTNKKLIFIVVLQYKSDGLPMLEVWIRTADNSKINLTQDMVEDCWKYGKAEMIELTEDNLLQHAQYFIKKPNTRWDCFPSYAKLFRCSKTGIEKVKVEIVDYAEAQRRVAGCNQTFASTKALVDEVDGKSIIYQQVTYETYAKAKNPIEFDTS